MSKRKHGILGLTLQVASFVALLAAFATCTLEGDIKTVREKIEGSGGSGGGESPPVIVPGSSVYPKLLWLESNAQSGGNYIIEASFNESIGPWTLSYSGKSNITITLKGVGANRIISISSAGSLFTIGSGVILILDNNITLQGWSNVNNSLVTINSGGTMVMNTGSAVTGNTVGTSGGGVYMFSNSTFLMNGGTISGNTAGYNGGGVFVGGGTFTMNGGTISGNTASNNGGGVYVQGIFTKAGGTIYGYSASDTVNSNVVKNSSGTVQSNSGHAVYAYISSSTNKRKETTAGSSVNLSFAYNGSNTSFSGGWDY